MTTNAVTPVGGPTTTFTHTWNLDGTLATKTDGTNLWVYNWDPNGDQRLLSVVLNGTTLVAYTYDYRGRMITRTVSGVTTTFEWNGWTCIRETTSGAQTRYYAPWGELLTFERGGVIYQVVSDALGCVRLVTDETGTVVAQAGFRSLGQFAADQLRFRAGRYALSVRGSAGMSVGFCYRTHLYAPEMV